MLHQIYNRFYDLPVNVVKPIIPTKRFHLSSCAPFSLKKAKHESFQTLKAGRISTDISGLNHDIDITWVNHLQWRYNEEKKIGNSKWLALWHRWLEPLQWHQWISNLVYASLGSTLTSYQFCFEVNPSIIILHTIELHYLNKFRFQVVLANNFAGLTCRKIASSI